MEGNGNLPSLMTELVELLNSKDDSKKEEIETLLAKIKEFASRDGTSILNFACCYGTSKGIKTLIPFIIDRGHSVNLMDDDGYTPLHLVCGNENVDLDTLELLIEKGADVNYCGGLYDSTPLHYACEVNTLLSAFVIDCLVKRGAKINERCDGEEYTPLHFACKNALITTEAITTLIKNGADVNAKESENYLTPLHIACQNKFVKEDIINALIEAGSDVDARDSSGSTPLHVFCQQNKSPKKQIIKTLIEKGAQVNQKNGAGRTPLMQLCDNEDVMKESVEFLLEKGAKINLKDSVHASALHIICSNDFASKKVIRILVKKGAQLNYKDMSGYTPICYACMNQYISIDALEYLINKGCKINGGYGLHHENLLTIACLKESVNAVQLLIKKGISVDSRNNAGCTALHQVCRKLGTNLYDPKCIEIVEILMHNGAILKIADNFGYLPTEYAPRFIADKILNLEIKLEQIVPLLIIYKKDQTNLSSLPKEILQEIVNLICLVPTKRNNKSSV